jgi:negative regulator of sigma-B (phosphoserine phosphatase)
MIVDIGIVNRPAEGETACGDGWTADIYDGGLLISVVDGLGHGPKAEEAAVAFTTLVREDPRSPLAELMRVAGERLSPTRGAAAALLRFDAIERRVEFCGVGNIAMHSVSDVKMHPVSAPGVLGRPVRKLLPFEFALPRNALVALCSDGISSRLELERFETMEPQEIANSLLELHGKSYDDATCLVMRFSEDD